MTFTYRHYSLVKFQNWFLKATSKKVKYVANGKVVIRVVLLLFRAHFSRSEKQQQNDNGTFPRVWPLLVIQNHKYYRSFLWILLSWVCPCNLLSGTCSLSKVHFTVSAEISYMYRRKKTRQRKKQESYELLERPDKLNFSSRGGKESSKISCAIF